MCFESWCAWTPVFAGENRLACNGVAVGGSNDVTCGWGNDGGCRQTIAGVPRVTWPARDRWDSPSPGVATASPVELLLCRFSEGGAAILVTGATPAGKPPVCRGPPAPRPISGYDVKNCRGARSISALRNSTNTSCSLHPITILLQIASCKLPSTVHLVCYEHCSFLSARNFFCRELSLWVRRDSARNRLFSTLAILHPIVPVSYTHLTLPTKRIV